MEPPPPYTTSHPTTTTTHRATFSTLPTSVQLRILLAFTTRRYGEEEYMRRLWRLHRSVRGVCRGLYLLSMSILRSHYLSTYYSLVRPPYTSDPFPSSSQSSSDGSPSNHLNNVISARGRETAVFDRFIARRLGDDVRKMESELCEGGDEEHDIFTRLQPQARCEDLLLQYGSNQSLIVPNGPLPTTLNAVRAPVTFSSLLVQFGNRKVTLYIRTRDGKKTLLVEVEREKNTLLETSVKDLLVGLREALR